MYLGWFIEEIAFVMKFCYTLISSRKKYVKSKKKQEILIKQKKVLYLWLLNIIPVKIELFNSHFCIFAQKISFLFGVHNMCAIPVSMW